MKAASARFAYEPPPASFLQRPRAPTSCRRKTEEKFSRVRGYFNLKTSRYKSEAVQTSGNDTTLAQLHDTCVQTGHGGLC